MHIDTSISTKSYATHTFGLRGSQHTLQSISQVGWSLLMLECLCPFSAYARSRWQNQTLFSCIIYATNAQKLRYRAFQQVLALTIGSRSLGGRASGGRRCRLGVFICTEAHATREMPDTLNSTATRSARFVHVACQKRNGTLVSYRMCFGRSRRPNIFRFSTAATAYKRLSIIDSTFYRSHFHMRRKKKHCRNRTEAAAAVCKTYRAHSCFASIPNWMFYSIPTVPGFVARVPP